MTSLLSHNRYYGRFCNFAVYQGRRAKFSKLGYFDFQKIIYFQNSRLLRRHYGVIIGVL